MLLKDLQKDIEKLIKSKPESLNMNVYIHWDPRDLDRAAYSIDVGTATPYPSRLVQGVIIE